MKSSRTLFLLSTLSTMSLLGTGYTWVNTTLTGNWDTPVIWTLNSGFPNSSADTATFPTGNASPITLTVDGILPVGS